MCVETLSITNLPLGENWSYPETACQEAIQGWVTIWDCLRGNPGYDKSASELIEKRNENCHLVFISFFEMGHLGVSCECKHHSQLEQ